MDMKTLLTVLLMLALTGCVGFDTRTQGSRTSPAPDKYSIDQKDYFWSQTEHPADGEVVLNSERKWCGLTLWAVLPIPLMLPVCKQHKTVTFKDNKPATLTEGWIELGLFAGCGPGVWLGTAIMHGREASFCAAVRD